MKLKQAKKTVYFGEAPITVDQVVEVARGQSEARLSQFPEFRARIEKSVSFLRQLLQEDGVIYGVTTGYGDSCTCLLYTSPSPRDRSLSRMPSSA